jgi:hypothetical protein
MICFILFLHKSVTIIFPKSVTFYFPFTNDSFDKNATNKQGIGHEI